MDEQRELLVMTKRRITPRVIMALNVSADCRLAKDFEPKSHAAMLTQEYHHRSDHRTIVAVWLPFDRREKERLYRCRTMP